VRAVEAVEALAAGGNCADDDALAYGVVLLQTVAKFLDDPHWLMAENQSRSYRVFTANDVHVSSADRRRADPNDGLARLRAWFVDLFDADVVDSVEDHRFHRIHDALLLSPVIEQEITLDEAQ
jgi:hypothetical protein